jgi:HEAT repeat protein
MPRSLRGIRLGTVLIAIAVLAIILGLGVQLYRALSPVRRWTLESRPGNPSRIRMRAVMNLRFDVRQSELEEAYPVMLAAAKDSDPWVRASAARALGGRRDHFAEVVATLQGLMKDPSPRVRECAILELESFVKPGSSEVLSLIPDVLAALDDPKPAVRLEACRALYVYKRLQADSRRVIPAMVRMIREETGTYRLGALGYLTMMKMVPTELEPTLRTLMKSEIPVERISARRALIILGIRDAERDAMIKSMLESNHLNERLAGADLLIQMGNYRMAIAALKDLIATEDIAMRSQARRLLATLNDGEASP